MNIQMCKMWLCWLAFYRCIQRTIVFHYCLSVGKPFC